MAIELTPEARKQAVSSIKLRDRLADLEGICYETEFDYWPKPSSVRRK